MSAASHIHAGDIGSFYGKSSPDFANNSFARRRLFFFLQLSLKGGIYQRDVKRFSALFCTYEADSEG
ncbi:hypothetical protein LIS66_26765 [Pseudomonas sp. HN2]|jgi:hypothetical protein|uniref:hypothetical protein n=1 Tax=Pseudomonas TaxID=286 RepID=UPI001D1598A0|nr:MULTISPECIES: hypothetical protein [Pseudomonas]UEB95919.1 hypothetical protein LIS66_26765 [Pseudomonas sp. HN2]UST64101.1 hypothetical protein NF673_26430 [Pseudomonas moraviensis]